MISSAFKAFIQYSFLNGLLVTMGLVFMTMLLFKAGKRIMENMYVQKDKAISGKIRNDQINDPTNV